MSVDEFAADGDCISVSARSRHIAKVRANELIGIMFAIFRPQKKFKRPTTLDLFHAEDCQSFLSHT